MSKKNWRVYGIAAAVSLMVFSFGISSMAETEETNPAMIYYQQYEQANADGNKAQMLDNLTESAKLGYLTAQEKLAEGYEKGTFGVTDMDQAIYWYHEAVKQNSSKSMMSIGLLYMEGKGVSQDYAQAMHFMLTSVAAGDRKGPRYVGIMYEHGYGTEVNEKRAFEYYQLGAARGDITSQYYLGRMYEYGQGTTQNFTKAMECYQEAAARGDKTAAVGMLGIASLYENGRGVTKDSNLANEWYQKAKETGYTVETGAPAEVIAFTEVFGNGQRITAVVLEYNTVIQNRSISIDSFTVTNRTVTKAYANTEALMAETGTNGRYIILELNSAEEEASVYEGGISNGGNGPPGTTGSGIVKSVYAQVKQEKSVLTWSDTPLLASGTSYDNTRIVNVAADDFIQRSYTDPETLEVLEYNLYIPKGYTGDRNYPLVLFMADASADGEDVMITLRQGNGATVWATSEEQEKHPSFVLAPQFSADDSDTIADTVVKLLYQLQQEYQIDASRIYTTGQSAGCIRSIKMNIEHRNLFAGLLLVAGQSDPEAMRVMKDDNIWILISEGDKKGYPGMNASIAAWEADGALISKAVWDAGWSAREYADAVASMRKQGNSIHYSMFKLGTTWDGDPAQESPNEHNSTMHVAYNIEGVRDWLFEQVLGETHP